MTESHPPYQVVSGDRVVGGIAHEPVMAIFERAGIHIPVELMPWSRAYTLAQEQPNTFIYSMVRTKARESQFIWVAPLAHFHMFLASRAGRGIKVDNLQQARRLVIGVKRDDVADVYLRSEGFTERHNLIAVTNETTSFQLLLNDRVDLIPISPLSTDATCILVGCSREDFELQFAIEALSHPLYLAASLNTDARLLERLRRARQNLVAEGALKPQ